MFSFRVNTTAPACSCRGAGSPFTSCVCALTNRQGHGKGVDYWTLGILIYEMLAGQPPFVDDDPMGIYQQILAGKLTFPRFFDRSAKNLIKKLLTADLTKRYGCLKNGAEDIKKHKWLNSIDYNAMYSRTLAAPLVPRVSGAHDTSNFDPYPDSVRGRCLLFLFAVIFTSLTCLPVRVRSRWRRPLIPHTPGGTRSNHSRKLGCTGSESVSVFLCVLSLSPLYVCRFAASWRRCRCSHRLLHSVTASILHFVYAYYFFLPRTPEHPNQLSTCTIMLRLQHSVRRLGAVAPLLSTLPLLVMPG